MLNCRNMRKIKQKLKPTGQQAAIINIQHTFVPARQSLCHSYNQLAPMPCCFSQVRTKYVVMSIICTKLISILRSVLLERECTKDPRANDIRQALLWSTQQLFINTVETNWAQFCVHLLVISFVVVNTTLYSMFCRCRHWISPLQHHASSRSKRLI